MRSVYILVHELISNIVFIIFIIFVVNKQERYIRYIASLSADSCPTDESILVLPYDSLHEFYLEYVAYSEADNLINYASKETFRLKFKSLSNEFKLMGSKGSFPTCDICRNANDLLRDRSIRDQHQREIILKFKRCAFTAYFIVSINIIMFMRYFE